MTGLIIPERMWLESFSSDEKTVTIKGIAYDNPTIAEFMEKLEKSPLFSAVDLKTAKMKSFKNDVMLKSFELLCLKEIPKDEEDKDAKQGKK
jgi:type IV pilus assembly protein PilN